MTGPEYTSCVTPGSYVDPPSDAGIVAGLNMWAATDYMLHGKLVCCGSLQPGTEPDGTPRLVASPSTGSTCAIGRVVSFEPPSSKSFPDSIDNDFSFNILPRPDDRVSELSDDPFPTDAWSRKSGDERLAAVRSGYQGELLTEQPGMPSPREADGGSRYAGYTSEMFFDPLRGQSGTSATVLASRVVWYRDGTVRSYPLTQTGGYDVPVLHCECEGTRIRDVFNVVDQMPGGGAGCKKHWYTAAACWFARLFSLPFTTAFVAEAWAKARDGNYHDALEDGGELHVGDLVLVRGRWVYDAGHHGYNEIHAVRTIQKIPDPPDPSTNAHGAALPPAGSPLVEFERFYAIWCSLAGQAPPDHADGERPADMTPAQTSTYDNQQRPENRYKVHPDLDGCIPAVAMTIREVEPAEINRELGEGTITITGTGFAGAATVQVLNPPVPTGTVTVQGSTRIVASLGIGRHTPLGPRDLVVRNPGGDSAMQPGALTIVDRPIIH